MTIPTDPTQGQIDFHMDNARKVYRVLENAAERLEGAVKEMLDKVKASPPAERGPVNWAALHCSGVYFKLNSEDLSVDWLVMLAKCDYYAPLVDAVFKGLTEAGYVDVEIICEW